MRSTARFYVSWCDAGEEIKMDTPADLIQARIQLGTEPRRNPRQFASCEPGRPTQANIQSIIGAWNQHREVRWPM